MHLPRRLLVLLGLAALFVLGGCGDDGVDAGGAGTTDPDTAVSSPPDTGAGDVNPDAPARRPVVVTAGLLNPVPTFIESFTAIDDVNVEFRFTTGVAECYGLDRVEVEESPEAVTVTLFTGSKPGADVCIEIAEAVVTTFALPSAIAGRVLVDGSTGEPVPVD